MDARFTSIIAHLFRLLGFVVCVMFISGKIHHFVDFYSLIKSFVPPPPFYRWKMEAINQKLNTYFEAWMGPRGEYVCLHFLNNLIFIFLLQLLLSILFFFLISAFQISGCRECSCLTITHQPLHSQSCTSCWCGWDPSTWNTDSLTPAEASWCSTIWASRFCPSTCAMR